MRRVGIGNYANIMHFLITTDEWVATTALLLDLHLPPHGSCMCDTVTLSLKPWHMLKLIFVKISRHLKINVQVSHINCFHIKCHGCKKFTEYQSSCKSFVCSELHKSKITLGVWKSSPAGQKLQFLSAGFFTEGTTVKCLSLQSASVSLPSLSTKAEWGVRYSH